MAALSTAFSFGMELYIIEDYKNTASDLFRREPEESQPGSDPVGVLSSQELTDRLVRHLLIENGYVEDEEEWARRGLRILRQEDGKPVINDPAICFSVSHTENIFGCVIARTEETDRVGLDLQKVRDMDVQKLARRYFTAEENRWMEKQPDGFFRLWTRKEAYGKYTGEGLAAVVEKAQVLCRRDVTFQDLVLGEGLYGCICSRGSITEEKSSQKGMEEYGI